GAGVDHTTHARLQRRLQQLARAVYIRPIQLLRVFRPETIIGGDMVQGITSGHRLPERFRIRKIAADEFDPARIERGEIVAAAVRAYKGADALAPRCQLLCHMAADKPRSARYQCRQEWPRSSGQTYLVSDQAASFSVPFMVFMAS